MGVHSRRRFHGTSITCTRHQIKRLMWQLSRLGFAKSLLSMVPMGPVFSLAAGGRTTSEMVRNIFAAVVLHLKKASAFHTAAETAHAGSLRADHGLSARTSSSSRRNTLTRLQLGSLNQKTTAPSASCAIPTLVASGVTIRSVLSSSELSNQKCAFGICHATIQGMAATTVCVEPFQPHTTISTPVAVSWRLTAPLLCERLAYRGHCTQFTSALF